MNMLSKRCRTSFVLVLLGFVPSAAAQQDDSSRSLDFDTHVAPVLVSHCLECHSGTAPEGGLSLVSPSLAMKGGESGRVIVPGNSADSVLWERIREDEMPPKNPLSDQDKLILKQWIEDGAAWGKSPLDVLTVSTATRAGRDWWSLQPLQEVVPPAIELPQHSGNDIDAFILKRLQQANLRPSPQADPRVLIRRLYFDLIGLPPTPEQIAAFVADPSDTAYQQMIDDLLDSRHYGERWGRHWLDVVRFGESDGFERNNPRENAWPYRDWIITAFNEDLPYDEFVRMQLIGDQLTGGIDGAAATGFWVAGVHNTVVGGSKRMKQLARQDEIEEVLATVGQSFVGLTINCARCHDHKFDPITQKEYYQFASAISGLGYGERKEQRPEQLKQLKGINSRLTELQAELAAIDQAARREIIAARKSGEAVIPDPPAAFARWEFDGNLNDSVGSLHGRATGNAHLNNGMLVLDGQSFVETSPLPRDIAEKTLEAWVQLDNLEQRGGAAVSLETRDGGVFDAIVFGEREPGRWMAGSNGFVRTDSFRGADEADATNRPVHVAIVYRKDGTIIGYRDGLSYGQSVRQSPLQTYKSGNAEILFGLRHRPPGGNRFLTAKIHRAAFYDRALSAAEIAASAGTALEYVPEEQIAEWLTPQQRQLRMDLKARIADAVLARDQKAAEASRTIFTLTAGAATTTNILLRGDPDSVGDVVSPAATSAMSTHPGDFGLSPDAPEVDRRRKLAEWITHPANPLFARVMVNRVWHYHFGAGIVDTPSDFGFNGGRPSHPELLDYLAVKFQESGYRLKWLHRLIVTTRTYRQSGSGISPDLRKSAAAIDASNRLLWQGPSRRLEAETLRDAMLSVAGQLQPDPGGPSFKDVSVTSNNGTTYYEPLDVDGPEFWRRTIYRFNPRGGRSALLDTFDCPDPATAAPRRSVTTTPLQALSLLNNSFVLKMADFFADRIQLETGDDAQNQVRRAWLLAIGRLPDETELQLSVQLVTRHGLPALCRGLFNFNEFVMIE